MFRNLNSYQVSFKSLCKINVFLLLAVILSACSINPATGDRQFTALMSPVQEKQVGAIEHVKILQQYGEFKHPTLNAYVNEIGQRVAKRTERPEVEYKFFILDSPIVNAFALPGGYIYVSRGLLALSNSEAELAAVLGHEIAHITARHSAERYSQHVLSSIGTGILGAAVGGSGVSQALELGSRLYLSSYSREQENQADTLGVRYLNHAGYHPGAMASFLTSLKNNTALEARITGKKHREAGYLSTHPATVDRIIKTEQEAENYSAQSVIEREKYLRNIKGLIYGDSVDQGFVRNQTIFVHPKIGFTFSLPKGYRIVNQPKQVLAISNNGSIVVFDMKFNPKGTDPVSYIQHDWMQGDSLNDLEPVTIHNMSGATADFQGQVNGKAMTVRIFAVEWEPNRIARFQIFIPKDMSVSQMKDLKDAIYSFRRLSDVEKLKLKPYSINLIAANPGDTLKSIAAKMPYKDEHNEERFRVLNALQPKQEVRIGQLYKTISGH